MINTEKEVFIKTKLFKQVYCFAVINFKARIWNMYCDLYLKRLTWMLNNFSED